MPDVPSTCRGASLQLDDLLAAHTCELKDTIHGREIRHPQANPAPPDDSLVISVEAPSDGVAAGSTADLAVTLKNATEGWLVVDFDVTCGAEGAFPAKALDAAGKRVDRVDLGCAELPICTSSVARVALEAGGVARKTLRFDTHVSKVAKNCKVTSAGTLRPGTYTLEISTPLERPDPEHPNWVKRLATRVPLVVR